MKRWRSIAAVVLVFLCGGAAGALITLKVVTRRAVEGDGIEGWTGRGVPRLARALDLTAEQRVAIRAIMAEAALEMLVLRRRVQPEMREVAERASRKISEELTPEQRQRFEALRERAQVRWGQGDRE